MTDDCASSVNGDPCPCDIAKNFCDDLEVMNAVMRTPRTSGTTSGNNFASANNTARSNKNHRLARGGVTLAAGEMSAPIQTALCKNRVHGFMTELKKAGTDFACKINLITDIDEELVCALNRLETQEEEITRYRQQVYKLEADLKAKNSKIRDTEKKYCEMNAKSEVALKQMAGELDSSKMRNKQLDDCLDEQKRNNSELNQRIEALKNKLKGSEKCASYYRSLNASLNNTLESKRKIIEDLQCQTQKYFERIVEFEKSKMSEKYLDQCDVEDQLQAAKLMLKEKDFEITQLWENLAMLESAVCENLSKIGVERRNYTKDTLVAATGGIGRSAGKPCCNSYCNILSDECQNQIVTCGSPIRKYGGGGGGAKGGGTSGSVDRDPCNSYKFEEVSKNLQNVLKKVTQLKQVHGNCRGAITNGVGRPALEMGKTPPPPAPPCCQPSTTDFNGPSCNCTK